MNIQRSKPYNMKNIYNEDIYIYKNIYNKAFLQIGLLYLNEKRGLTTDAVYLYKNYEEFSWHNNFSSIHK